MKACSAKTYGVVSHFVPEHVMKISEPGVPLDREQLTLFIAVAMAADSKRAPILRGKNAPVDAFERDRIRHEFAHWLATRMLAGNLRVVLGPAANHGHFPGVKAKGCCPVGAVHGHA